jgi:hypothetical protein
MEVSVELGELFKGPGAKKADTIQECTNGYDDDLDGRTDQNDNECADGGKWEDDGPTAGPAVTWRQRATNMEGSRLDKIVGKAEGDVHLGRLRFKAGVSLAWDFNENVWDLTGKSSLPMFPNGGGPPEISVTVGGKGLAVNKIVGEVSNLNLPGPYGMYWQRFKLGGRFGDDWEVLAGLGMSVGKRFLVNEKPVALVDIDGDVTINTTSTKLEGKVALLGFETLTGSLEVTYREDVKLSAAGTMHLAFPAKSSDPFFYLSGKAKLDGRIGLDGSLDATGSTEACWAVKRFGTIEVEPSCGVKFRSRV